MTFKTMAIKQDNSGIYFDAAHLDMGKKWEARVVDENRILLQSSNFPFITENYLDGFAKCSAEVFRDLLVGINQRKWSGLITTDSGFGVKKIFFSEGEIIFASSNLIDDRLGEIIYRESMITLDQLTEAAVKVDRNNKFGQVLLTGKVFDNNKLWTALKLQVRSIFYSLFLPDEIFFQLESGKNLTANEIVFEDGTAQLIDEGFALGCQFHSFRNRLTEATTIEISNLDWQTSIQEGTFMHDLFELIGVDSHVDLVIKNSKLSQLNTLNLIFRFSQLGFCKLRNRKDSHRSLNTPVLSRIRARLDTYSMLLHFVKSSFQATEIAFPFNELRQFALSLNSNYVTSFFIDSDGMVDADCVESIAEQCLAHPASSNFFETRIHSLTRFIFQIALDNLPQSQTLKLKDFLRDIH